ncbi:MAG: DUF1552 domain-containing protein [Planctomycetaceae bacterium]|nr:DUF1552 domain-containing protein [Planctomycetaceae bacterium]
MSQQVHRRSVLKSGGVCLALPLLESFPASCRGDDRNAESVPRRMVCIGNEFGMFPGAFWPKSHGTDYDLPELLQPLESHRREFTLFSHLDHGLKGGHFAVHTYLTGVHSADARGMPDGGISLDQRAAEHVGAQTRFPSLAVGSDDGLHGGCQMSWTRTGTRVPPVPGPRELFRFLFVADDADARRRAEERVELQSSILDAVRSDADSLQKQLSRTDRDKLDEYFTSVRDVEVKLSFDRKWQSVPKPQASIDEPQNQGLTKDLPAIYDLLALALQTDSTRVATLEIGGTFVASDLGIRQGYHSLSHHGQDPEKIALLVQLEKYQTQQFSRFLDRLKNIREPHTEGTLLDRTMVLMGSGMGNANSHTNTDLPIILAGGGFRHGEYKPYPSDSRRVPLCNLFVSMLQRFGVETDFFSGSTGTLTGLEIV